MVSIGEGLRMMQGGVDRTGYADMAESLGNPGLDLIAARRAAASEAEALKEYERKQAESDEKFRSEIDKLLEGVQQSSDDPIDGSKQKIDLVPGGAFDKALTGGLTGSFFGLPGAVIGTGVGLASQGYEDMMSRIVGEFDEGGSFEGGLSYGEDADYIDNLNKIFQMGAMQGGLPMANGGPVYESLEDYIADQKAEELARKSEEFRSQMEQPLDKPSLDQYTEDSMLMLSERPDSVFLDPPVGIDGNTIQEAPPIGISGTITDDELTAGYGMPVGTGGISGQLTVPFENDPMLQLMLEQRLADDLSLNADVSLMEDMDPFFNLKMTKDF